MMGVSFKNDTKSLRSFFFPRMHLQFSFHSFNGFALIEAFCQIGSAYFDREKLGFGVYIKRNGEYFTKGYSFKVTTGNFTPAQGDF